MIDQCLKYPPLFRRDVFLSLEFGLDYVYKKEDFNAMWGLEVEPHWLEAMMGVKKSNSP